MYAFSRFPAELAQMWNRYGNVVLSLDDEILSDGINHLREKR